MVIIVEININAKNREDEKGESDFRRSIRTDMKYEYSDRDLENYYLEHWRNSRGWDYFDYTDDDVDLNDYDRD